MKYKLSIAVLLLLVALGAARAQVASHASTLDAKTPASQSQPTGKPVARINGVALTDRDLLREMFAIFPYARQHNGFPKSEEAEIRKGALEMIVFEELVYQEAERRKMTVPPAKLNRAAADLRARFNSSEEYQQFLQTEFKGSRPLLLKKIRRSMLIEALLQAEVQNKSAVPPAEVRAFYDKNPARFETTESFTLQTITILPPAKPTAEQLANARKRAEEALRQAKATKNYEEFGLLAEKISEDDYRVNMGEHKPAERAQLPPPVLQAVLALQPGQVSDLIQVEQAYTIIRLGAHNAAGKKKFADVKEALQKELKKKKTNQLRVELDRKLRKSARVELLSEPGVG
jgi:peptidyl-prolyl cis-trans isomerase SurA